MIDSISGTLQKKEPTFAIIDVGGIRMKLGITISTYERLPSTGNQSELLVYFHVREDILALYGFDNEEQRSMFMLLIGISGIGPRSAMGILSGASTSEFKKRIIADDVKSLMIIPGIGAKTAKRIIVELKDKFIKEEDEEFISLDESGVITAEMNDAYQVLQSLGYSHMQAQKAMKKVEISGGLSGGLEDMIKQLLSNI